MMSNASEAVPASLTSRLSKLISSDVNASAHSEDAKLSAASAAASGSMSMPRILNGRIREACSVSAVRR